MTSASVSSEAPASPDSQSPPATEESPPPLNLNLSNIPPPSPSTCLAYGCKKAARKFRTLCNAHQKQREKKGFIQLYNGQVSYVHHKHHHRQLIQEHRQNQQNSANDGGNSGPTSPNGDQPKRNKRGRPRKYPLSDNNNFGNGIGGPSSGEGDEMPAMKTRPTRTTRKNTRYYDSDHFEDELFDEEEDSEQKRRFKEEDEHEEDDEEEEYLDTDDESSPETSKGMIPFSSHKYSASSHMEDSQQTMHDGDDEEEVEEHRSREEPLQGEEGEDFEFQEFETDDPHYSFSQELTQATQRLNSYRKRLSSSKSGGSSKSGRTYTEEDEVGLLSFLINSATTSPVIPSPSIQRRISAQQLQESLNHIPSESRHAHRRHHYLLNSHHHQKKHHHNDNNNNYHDSTYHDESSSILNGGPKKRRIHDDTPSPEETRKTRSSSSLPPPPSDAFAEILASMDQLLNKGASQSSGEDQERDVHENGNHGQESDESGSDSNPETSTPPSSLYSSKNLSDSQGTTGADDALLIASNGSATASTAGVCGKKSMKGSNPSEPTPILSM